MTGYPLMHSIVVGTLCDEHTTGVRSNVCGAVVQVHKVTSLKLCDPRQLARVGKVAVGGLRDNEAMGNYKFWSWECNQHVPALPNVCTCDVASRGVGHSHLILRIHHLEVKLTTKLWLPIKVGTSIVRPLIDQAAISACRSLA